MPDASSPITMSVPGKSDDHMAELHRAGEKPKIVRAASLSDVSTHHSSWLAKGSPLQRFIAAAKNAHAEAEEKEKQRRLDPQFSGPLHEKAHWLLHETWLDLFLGVMILFNLAIVIIETDAGARGEASPGWAKPFSWIILLTFVFELCLRIFVLGSGFLFEPMNIFDFIIIATDLSTSLLEAFLGSVLSLSFLRIVRLCKLARVAQAFRVCTELRLLLAGLLGSLKAIFWGTVLLMLFLTIWAVVAVQFLHPLNLKLAEQGKYEDCERCARAYASVFDASLIFFQQIVAGDSWGLVTVTVIEEYPQTILIYGPLFLSVGLAVLNLILGVVVDVASQARGSMQSELEDDKLVSKKELQYKLLETCKEMDSDGSGMIDKDELKRGYEDNEEFRDSLTGIGISLEELDILWTLLDTDKSGTVAYAEFVTECYKMKTSHSDFMLAYIKYYVTVIKFEIVEEIQLVKLELQGEDAKIAQVEKEMLAEERLIGEGITEIGKVEREIETNEKDIESKIGKIETEMESPKALGSTLQSGAEMEVKEFLPCLREIQDGGDKGVAANPNFQKKTLDPDIQAKQVSDFTMGTNPVLLDALDMLNKTQRELLASIQDIKKQLNVSSAKVCMTESVLLATPELGAAGPIPNERAFSALYPSSCCAGNSARVKVMPLAPTAQEGAR